MVNQQTSTGTNTQPSNNNNIQDSLLRSTFVVQPDPPSATRTNEALRSRSADSRPPNTNTPASNIDDDDDNWIDLPSADIPVPPLPPMPAQLPNPPVLPIPRIRGPAIIRMLSLKNEKFFEIISTLLESIDRSLPCASPYFTQTLRPPFDNPNNATNLTPNEAAALNNASNRAVIFATGPQRPRGRHRHPAGPWAQQNQPQQIPNFMLSSPGAPTGATVFTPAGHAYNMTTHSFEIPMVISTTTTAEMPQQQQQQQQQQAANINILVVEQPLSKR